MKRFVPREKMSKRDRKKLDAAKRTLWQVDPVTKVVKSKKVYDRKKQSRNCEPYDLRDCFFVPEKPGPDGILPAQKAPFALSA